MKEKVNYKVLPVYAMKGYGRVEVQVHAFLTSTLDGGEWSASRPGDFTPDEGIPITH
jgi:hypothetical protein